MIDDLLYRFGRLQRMEPERFANYPLKMAAGEYIFLTPHRSSNVPPLWDGKASERIWGFLDGAVR